jgi:hypothetical protein
MTSNSRNIRNFFVKFGKLLLVGIDCSNTQDVQTVFSQSTSLVKADNVDLASYIDPIRRDAKDSTLAEAVDGKCRSDRQGSG